MATAVIKEVRLRSLEITTKYGTVPVQLYFNEAYDCEVMLIDACSTLVGIWFTTHVQGTEIDFDSWVEFAISQEIKRMPLLAKLSTYLDWFNASDYTNGHYFDYMSDHFNELFTDTGLFEKYEKFNLSYDKYKDGDGWANALLHYWAGSTEDMQNFGKWIKFILDTEQNYFGGVK